MSKLQDYLELRENFRKQIEEGTFPAKDMLILQELNYRIEILDTLKNFCRTAPISADMRVIGYHHKLVLAFVARIAGERKLGEKADTDTAQRRETAQNTLLQVVEDCSKRFAAFHAESGEQYKNALRAFVDTILPVWLQFRTSYVDIRIANEGAGSSASATKPAASQPVGNESDEEVQFKRATSMKCPIKKYSGKTLGDLLSLDPKALKWLATDFDGETSIKAAAKFICEYALKKCA